MSKRYKNVIRNQEGKRVGFLEGNKRWYAMFSGEEFYVTRGGHIYCTFLNHKEEVEKLFLGSLDVSEYDLLQLGLDLSVIKYHREKPPQEKRRVVNNPKIFIGVSYEKKRKGFKKWKATIKTPNGIKSVGYFASQQEAQEAQANAYTKYHQENNNG
ncbi:MULTISPECIES: hypothetical protein [Deinococcus]|uniref:AP2/ERF domain-containing protein n=1 Tax=Deinococcus rufus TaxID=2136097 RepID=A0ABV7ZA18_9DEIO|nr:hypothetical protein [Deinococcus sp. AB2017081]WQE94415.1 hypothetical protein U2P90_13500 [Deinococcus sp. AB2017081]